MSIIAALISKRHGVIASDGRIFDSAYFENGRLTKMAPIRSDTLNKTFALSDGKIIGAFCGLMEFSGKTVSEHILDAGSASPDTAAALDSLATKIRDEMGKRLAEIDSQEVIFACRKLDLLLVGSSKCKKPEMQIVAVSFFPQDDRILSKMDTVSVGDQNQYYVFGENQAREGAQKIFKSNRARNQDLTFLKKLAMRAIQAGIGMAGPHPNGSERSCGGTIFMQCISC